MPIYSFECKKCGRLIKTLQEYNRLPRCCGDDMEKLIPSIAQPVALEKKDDLRNKQVMKGLNGIMKARAKKHFMENELSDKVEEQGERPSQQAGWLKPDGTLKKFEDST